LTIRVLILFGAFIITSSAPLYSTVLTHNECAGGGNRNCQGSIDVLPGARGVFKTSTSAELYYNQLSADFRTVTKVSVGSLQSSVFVNSSGHSEFYYQITLNKNAAPVEDFFVGSQTGFWLVDVGIIKDSLQAGSLSFVDSNRVPTTIAYVSSNYPELDFSFLSDPLEAGETSATLVWKTDADYWKTTPIASANTIVLNDGFRLGYSLDGEVLIPDKVPEPRTMLMMGLGLVVFLFTRLTNGRLGMHRILR